MAARHTRPASIPTNRANPPTKGKPIGMPKPLQMFVSILRITRLRRINDRGNCGRSAARVHFNVWNTLAKLLERNNYQSPLGVQYSVLHDYAYDRSRQVSRRAAQAIRIAVLVNPANPPIAEASLQEMPEAAVATKYFELPLFKAIELPQ
jgi:hypothetical protein